MHLTEKPGAQELSGKGKLDLKKSALSFYIFPVSSATRKDQSSVCELRWHRTWGPWGCSVNINFPGKAERRPKDRKKNAALSRAGVNSHLPSPVSFSLPRGDFEIYAFLQPGMNGYKSVHKIWSESCHFPSGRSPHCVENLLVCLNSCQMLKISWDLLLTRVAKCF